MYSKISKVIIAALLGLSLGLVGCDVDDDEPFEEAGEEIEEGLDETGDALDEAAEEVEEDIEDIDDDPPR